MGVFDLSRALLDAVARHQYDSQPAINLQQPAQGSVPVRGDPQRIAQILDNVLGNALKYSRAATSVEVSLTVHDEEAQIRIADHGVGIPRDERDRLFTPFFRSSRTWNIPGTGLGLHISQLLACRHGGRLWLESSSSAGSVFALALPVVKCEARPP